MLDKKAEYRDAVVYWAVFRVHWGRVIFAIAAMVYGMVYTGYYTVAQRNEFYFPVEKKEFFYESAS